LKADYEMLKQLYEVKLNEDLRDKIIIGVVAALVGCGIGAIIW
jgi:peptidase E